MSGLLLVYATRSVPIGLVPPGMELCLNIDIDWTVILFLFAITAGTTLVFGLLPAFETSKVDIAHVLKEGTGTATAGHRRGVWREIARHWPGDASYDSAVRRRLIHRICAPGDQR
jgi:hypothetical protein